MVIAAVAGCTLDDVMHAFQACSDTRMAENTFMLKLR